MSAAGAKISDHANVDHETCAVGGGTRIWQYASVIRGAVIGENCTVGSCSIVDGAVVGARCAIGHGAQVHPGVVIGNDVFVGPGAIFCNDRWPSTSKDGFDLDEFKRMRCVIVDDGASVGAGAIILPGVRIGKNALVGAGVVCVRDVPPDHVLYRDGSFEPKPADINKRRMVWAY